MAKVAPPGMTAKVGIDTRMAIEREGRVPELVVLVFAEPTEDGETRVRVNEYVQSEGNERILDAIRGAIDKRRRQEVVEMVDPYHPRRRNVRARVTYGERGTPTRKRAEGRG